LSRTPLRARVALRQEACKPVRRTAGLKNFFFAISSRLSFDLSYEPFVTCSPRSRRDLKTGITNIEADLFVEKERVASVCELTKSLETRFPPHSPQTKSAKKNYLLNSRMWTLKNHRSIASRPVDSKSFRKLSFAAEGSRNCGLTRANALHGQLASKPVTVY